MSSIDRPSSTAPVTGANYPSLITEEVRCLAWPKSLFRPDMRIRQLKMAYNGHNRRPAKRSNVKATEGNAYHRRWPPIKNLNAEETTIPQPAQNQQMAAMKLVLPARLRSKALDGKFPASWMMQDPRYTCAVRPANGKFHPETA